MHKRLLYLLGIIMVIIGTLASPVYADIFDADEEKIDITGFEGNSCAWCHSELGARLTAPVEGWNESIHKASGVACADCHGGDPEIFDMEAMDEDEAGFTGKPQRRDIPELCAKCHSSSSKMSEYGIALDQLAKYKNSKHGRLLFEKNDKNVPTCVNCHGSHNILKVKDRKSPVYYMNIPETCKKCHSDEKKMARYGIPTNQYENYGQGIHGQVHYGKFPDKKPGIAPNCVSCHGKHIERSLNPEGVVNICGHCHVIQADKFRESPHGALLGTSSKLSCITCHGKHKNDKPNTSMLSGGTRDKCIECHEKSSNAFKIGVSIKKSIEESHESLKSAREAINAMEEGRLNTDILENQFSEALTHMHINHAITHALNINIIKEHTLEAITLSDKIIARYDEYKLELKNRFKLYLVVMVMIIIAIVLVYLKLYIVRKEDKEKK